MSPNAKNLLLSLWFALFIFALAPVAYCQSSDDCMICHSNSSLSMTRRGKTVSLYVNGARMKKSVHAAVTCVNCHVGLKPGDIPHAKIIKPVDCQTCHPVADFAKSAHGMPSDKTGKDKVPAAGCKACHGAHDILRVNDPKSPVNAANVTGACAVCHKDAVQEFLASAHGSAEARAKAPSCVSCHGVHNVVSTKNAASPVFKTKEAALCLKCHLDNPEVRGRIGASAGFIAGYQKSVHGMALASGNLKAATCSDCHGSHDLKKPADSSSRVSRQNISATCAVCHPEVAKQYSESIHGLAVRRGEVDSPTCTDCHGEHLIYSRRDSRSRVAPTNVSEKVCAQCHNSVQLNEKYGMSSDKFKSFTDSYHGLASRAGSVEVANCASCHGIHNIKPSSDPSSTVNRANLAVTCGKCHPGANENFARGAVHVIVGSPSGAGILNWIRAIYICLIVLVIGGMFFHNLLDFVQKTRLRFAVRLGKAVREHHGSGLYVRMTLNERIQHAAMFSSFILLALTGFMLRYPDSWWVLAIREWGGSFFQVRGLVHRIAAVVMIGISLYHLFYLLTVKRGRQLGKDLLPRWKDFKDFFANLRYIAGLSKRKPSFDRFGYVEKAEYWALVWGVILMTATGFILWFEGYFINLLTKLGWDISRTIHFYEAVLATLAILVWHFYFVIFNPDVYPMSTAWLNGKISEEEMAEEHPLELERIRRSGERE